jgi:hypothetical protein
MKEEFFHSQNAVKKHAAQIEKAPHAGTSSGFADDGISIAVQAVVQPDNRGMIRPASNFRRVLMPVNFMESNGAIC